MKYIPTFVLVLAMIVHADNPIKKGSMRISGGLSIIKQTSTFDEGYGIVLYPSIDRFFNSNIGIGLHSIIDHFKSDHYEYTTYNLIPTITFVAEKPKWPFFISTGPILYLRETNGMEVANITGWKVESGLYMFVDDNFFVSPLIRYEKNPNHYVKEALEFKISVGYFFHPRAKKVKTL